MFIENVQTRFTHIHVHVHMLHQQWLRFRKKTSTQIPGNRAPCMEREFSDPFSSPTAFRATSEHDHLKCVVTSSRGQVVTWLQGRDSRAGGNGLWVRKSSKSEENNNGKCACRKALEKNTLPQKWKSEWDEVSNKTSKDICLRFFCNFSVSNSPHLINWLPQGQVAVWDFHPKAESPKSESDSALKI